MKTQEVRWLDTKEVAAFIRQDLKKAFPRTKFSVKLSRYSMGSSVSVRWMDGPSVAQVQALTNLLDFHRFDGMQDLAWTAEAGTYRGELVRATCSISVDRSYSPAACEIAVRAVRSLNMASADADTLTVRVSSYDGSGRIDSSEADQYDHWSAWSMAHQALREWTEYPGAATAEQAEQRTAETLREGEEREALRAHEAVAADIEEIKAELSALGFAGAEVVQSAEGVYTADVGLRNAAGRPLYLVGSVAQVVSMAARRAPAPAPVAQVQMTAAELLEVEQAAREMFAGLVPPEVLEQVISSTARRVNVTDHGRGAVWLEAPEGFAPGAARVLN